MEVYRLIAFSYRIGHYSNKRKLREYPQFQIQILNISLIAHLVPLCVLKYRPLSILRKTRSFKLVINQKKICKSKSFILFFLSNFILNKQKEYTKLYLIKVHFIETCNFFYIIQNQLKLKKALHCIVQCYCLYLPRCIIN